MHGECRVVVGSGMEPEGPGWGLGIGGQHQVMEWVWRAGAAPDILQWGLLQ